MPISTMPPEPPAEIRVTNADDDSPYILTGFKVFGREAELDKVAAAVAAQGFASARSAASASEYGNIMIVFRPGSDMAAALDFYHKAVRGELADVSVRSLVISVDAAHDADGIKGSEIEVWDPDDAVEE